MVNRQSKEDEKAADKAVELSDATIDKIAHRQIVVFKAQLTSEAGNFTFGIIRKIVGVAALVVFFWAIGKGLKL